MKKIFFIFLLPLLALTACSNNDDSKDNALVGTTWSQTIGETTYWFWFKDNLECSYRVTVNGEDPYNSLSSTYKYTFSENNTIKIYAGVSILEKNIWLSGNLSNSTISLNSENETFTLTKYTSKQ